MAGNAFEETSDQELGDLLRAVIRDVIAG
jgi:hypothetical protein